MTSKHKLIDIKIKLEKERQEVMHKRSALLYDLHLYEDLMVDLKYKNDITVAEELCEIKHSEIRDFRVLLKNIDDEIYLISSLLPTYTDFIKSTYNMHLGINSYLLRIEFRCDQLTFDEISFVNGLFKDIESIIIGSRFEKLKRRVTRSQFETTRIEKGSLVQFIVGNFDNIALFSGLLFAASKAVLSIGKSALELKKLALENEKTKLEISNLKDKTSGVKKRTDEYIELLKNSFPSENNNLEVIAKNLETINQSDSYIKIVKVIDYNLDIRSIYIEKTR